MLDLDAALLPGAGAAGIPLGISIDALLAATSAFRRLRGEEFPIALPDGMARYGSPAVGLWTEGGIVEQILVRAPYRGLLAQRIGVGSTVADVEEHLGPVSRVDLSLVVSGVRGVSFETDGPGRPDEPGFRAERLTGIYVFLTDPGE